MNPSATDMPRAVPLVGRILLALLFLVSGAGKIALPGATQGYIASAGLPFPLLAYVVAVVVELGGATMLVAGYRTRWAAAVLAVYSVVAALAFHYNFGDQNQLIHFLKNVAIAGGLLQLVAFGPGSLSLDHRRDTAAAHRYAT
ncbi:MAG: DoxX family protein [Rhizobacter sp.]